MASEPSQFVFDGQLDFTGGQDASKTPDNVPPNAVYAAVNTSFRNGSLGPRPGFTRLDLIFPRGALVIGDEVTPTFEQIFHQGKFQALIPYIIENVPHLIIVISGIVYLVNEETLQVTMLLLPGGDRLNQYAPRLNWSFAARFIVIFDFPNLPVIIENTTIRRSNPAVFEVPISNIGAYNQNRLFIGNIGNEFTAGDPTGSLAAPNAPITFMEIEQPGSPYLGQVFQLPTNYNNVPITAMGFLEFVDSSTGIGPLIIATANQIFSVNSQNPRSVWEQGQFVQSLVSNSGIAGQQAMINVNSDLFFVSGDGQLRTLSMSRSEQGKWSKVPISREVQNWLKYYDISLAKYAALGYFKNTIMMTANPYRVVAKTLSNENIFDYANGGIVAIETDNISTLRGGSPPVWAGLWTAVRPMDFCNNFERCFVMSKDDGDVNNLWEITPTRTYDLAAKKIRYIKSRIYTKELLFNDPFTYKVLNYIDIPFQAVEGDFKLNVTYRPDSSPTYLPWGVFNVNVPWRTCDLLNTCNFNGFAPLSLSELRIGSPENVDCDPVTQYLYRFFKKTQILLQVEALNWELPYFKIKAVTQPRADTDTPCESLPTVVVCKDCDMDWFIPPFESCEDKET